jgi:hypothetical protein
MYCGETIEFQNSELPKASESTLQIVSQEYKQALEKISCLVENIDQILPQFTKKNYNASFENYVQTGFTALQPIERYVTVSEIALGRVADEAANALLQNVVSEIEDRKGGLMNSAKKARIDQYRFFLAVYTVPMILHLNYKISNPLADKILDQWVDHFPDFAFKKAGYDELESGFERKGLCYITTAVCETRQMSDNCYELTAMRNFRDTYMQQTKERQGRVEEYYSTAPAIVAMINMQQGCEEKYRSIWEKYLRPCIIDIEKNRLKQCEKRYTRMVRKLKKEYHVDFL